MTTDEVKVSTLTNCYHCGDPCDQLKIEFDQHNFCCEGCKNVYSILNQNNMCQYYSIQQSPGTSKSKESKADYDFLDNPDMEGKLIDYKDEGQTRVSFYVPAIHCASCIWLLENLHKLKDGILQTEVNFTRKTVYIIFQQEKVSLKGVVLLMHDLGYKPEFTFDDIQEKRNKSRSNKSFTYKLGVAGFCFGNIMLFSFPEYFHLNDIVDPGFRPFFGYLNLLLSLPVLLYSGSGYFISAWQGLKHKFINIDVPLALGIAVMFVRSSYEIISGTGAGFMDALAGLVFFLLIGKWFQNKTYGALSFDRDYKSYLPISVLRLQGDKEISISIDQIEVGDTIIVRNNEILPADSILLKGDASIDYSFVTGESAIVGKVSGDRLYAGGKQTGGIITVQVVKPVSQSYLTQLWNQEVFTKRQGHHLSTRVSTISKYFTLVILLIAAVTAGVWAVLDPSKILNSVTSILIITCPCALALTLPFTFGNALRILNRNKLYLKNSVTIERLAKVDTIVFDKTGTITLQENSEIEFTGDQLTEADASIFKSIFKSSNHPLSRTLFSFLPVSEYGESFSIIQVAGKGVEAKVNNHIYKIGSSVFVCGDGLNVDSGGFQASRVFISKDDVPLGHFRIKNTYRDGMGQLAEQLSGKYKIHILSGDNDGEQVNIANMFGTDASLRFNQTPVDKLNYINQLQQEGRQVLMIGDGLNDAGALKQADVGLAVTEDANNFFPAADGMLKADSLVKLNLILRFTKVCMQVMRYSFFISLLYNVVGLYFAVRGELLPVIAAILMPLSSVSVISFTVLSSTLKAKRIGL